VSVKSGGIRLQRPVGFLSQIYSPLESSQSLGCKLDSSPHRCQGFSGTSLDSWFTSQAGWCLLSHERVSSSSLEKEVLPSRLCSHTTGRISAPTCSLVRFPKEQILRLGGRSHTGECAQGPPLCWGQGSRTVQRERLNSSHPPIEALELLMILPECPRLRWDWGRPLLS
jgi:hypothetical protein